MKADTIFPLTREEILENYPEVFHNEFEQRTLELLWVKYRPLKYYTTWYGCKYTKGSYSFCILKNTKGEKDVVEFWKYKKDGKMQYGYSFKKREIYPDLLK